MTIERSNAADLRGAANVDVVMLSPLQWREFKMLRLEALQTNPVAFATRYDEAVAWSDEVWTRRLADPHRIHLAALSRGRLIGMVGAIAAMPDEPGVAIVVSMYVTGEWRGVGVGRRLFGVLIDRLSRCPDVTTVRLWVTETQVPARRLYESFGFQVITREDQAIPSGNQFSAELMMERSMR